VSRLRARLEIEARQVGEQVGKDNQDLGTLAALRVQPHQPGLQVDVAPAQQAQLVLPQTVPGHERDGHAVAELWLRLDDRRDALDRVRPAAVRLRPARPRQTDGWVPLQLVERCRPAEERAELRAYLLPRGRRPLAVAAVEEVLEQLGAAAALEVAEL
jgi:hypothetical protein